MIVKHHEKGWEIISHYTHGLLSGKVASQLKKELMPEHWVDVITGIVEHDDHLLDFEERDYLTGVGTPLDFTMEGGTDAEALEHARRVFSNAMQKSQLIALIVGRHLNFLYKALAKDYGPMKEFLDDIRKLQKVQRKLYGMNKEGENALYDILLFCDRCSLILCQDEIPEVGRKLEINRTIGNETYYIHKDQANILKIEPWPFEQKTFNLDFEYRVLTKVKFKSNSELKQALKKAPVKIRSLTISKC